MAYLCINFYETKVPIVRVKTLVNCHPATKVTDRGFLISQFKYWYGIYNGKLIADELKNLPLDMYAFPIRTMKRNHALVTKFERSTTNPNRVNIIDSNGVVIPYPYVDANTKCFLIGKDKQALIQLNRYKLSDELLEQINIFLQNNPCYIALLDNGRYGHIIYDVKNKYEFTKTGFAGFNDLFVFGEKLK